MRRLLIITGATATGKSALAQALARLRGAHIVSIDALKVYRGMDIGTDKPPKKVRAEITHHMLDLVEPSEKYSVARYIHDVRPLLERLQAERIPFLLEGGTPLYIKALTEGLFEGVGENADLRRQLEEEAARHSTKHLHERLAQVDPVAAAKIHPNDKRRIIRALEVYMLTGMRISDLQREFGRVRLARFVVVLWRGRDELRRLISQRVRSMFERGFVEEVAGLVERGGLGPTASQAAGYSEVLAYLEGKISLKEAMRRTATRHWQLARRQMVWLKRFSDAVHICLRGEVDWSGLAGRMAQRLKETTLYP